MARPPRGHRPFFGIEGRLPAGAFKMIVAPPRPSVRFGMVLANAIFVEVTVWISAGLGPRWKLRRVFLLSDRQFLVEELLPQVDTIGRRYTHPGRRLIFNFAWDFSQSCNSVMLVGSGHGF